MNLYGCHVPKMEQGGSIKYDRYVFSRDGWYYSQIKNEATGEITEYPFEEMDPYTEYEYFEAEDKEMFIITSNSSGEVEQQLIFENIFED